MPRPDSRRTMRRADRAAVATSARERLRAPVAARRLSQPVPLGRDAAEERRYLGKRIRLSETSGKPVYLQLADQLKYLIATGELTAGSRLPSARHLADNVSINRNTVLSAYAILGRDGYVAANRGGGTVVLAAPMRLDPYREAVLRPEVLDLVDQMVMRASDLGIASEQLASLVASHASTGGQRSPLRVGFVECNRQSLSHFVGPIEREFGVVVRPVLVDDIGAAAERGDFKNLDCVVSTFYHFSTVRRLLREAEVETELFAIAARPHVSILEELERLPRGATVGVVYFGHEGDDTTADRLRRMTEAIEQTNIKNIKAKPLLLPERPDRSVFAHLDAVVVRSENMSAARKAIPVGIKVIEFINDLDNASRRFLQEVFEDLRSRRNGGSRPSRAPAGA